MSRTLTQVPPGVQCFVGDEARRRRAIEDVVLGVFEGWDYEEIIPPLFDYADVFGGGTLAHQTYSFVGRDGSLLALRPDFTSLLAKLAAGRLHDRPAPIRLYYSGEVLRYEPPKAGRQSELYQIGLEHLGGESRTADVEVLAVAAESLDRLGASGWVIALGHVGVFAGLVAAAGTDPAQTERLRSRIEAKDVSGVRDILAGARTPAPVAEALVRLCSFAGDPPILRVAEQAFAAFPAAAAAVGELQAVVAALDAAGLLAHVAIDLGEVRGLDYYTGFVFRVYARGLGFEVGGGGRYDTLLARFGRPMPAVGFMLGLDRVALLLQKQERSGGTTVPSATVLHGADIGVALREARALRADGRRVRFGNGSAA